MIQTHKAVLFSLGVAIFLIGFGLGYFFNHLAGDGFFLIKKSTSSLVSAEAFKVLKDSPSPKLPLRKKVKQKQT